MRSVLRWVCGGVVTAVLGSCGLPGASPPTAAQPIVASAETWTWIDFPDATCDDGSTTGIGVSLSSRSKNVLLYFMGGGACWDYVTCATLNTSTHGPIKKADFEKVLPLIAGSGLDRAPGTLFADYSMVIVPYCTGDLHVGDKLATYQDALNPLNKRVIHHKGRPNTEAFLRRLAPTFPQIDKLVVSGSSAGGYGVTLSYALVREAMKPKQAYLMNDCAPPLVNDAVPAALRQAWWVSWNLDKTVSPSCPGCKDDFSQILPTIANTYVGDRMALWAFDQDEVIRSYLGFQTPTQMQANVATLVSQRIEPLANMRYFVAPGTSHTFFGQFQTAKAQGINLKDFARLQVSDDAGWRSTKP